MPESAFVLIHIDVPGPNLVLPVGRSRVQGWMVSKPGCHYTDLRIKSGPLILPGIYGFPRRDVAEFLKSDRPCLLTGFEIGVDLPAGRHRLTLEGCSINGGWDPLTNLEIETQSNGATDPVTAVVPLRAREFGEALRVSLRRMRTLGVPASISAAGVFRDTPYPHYLRHPHLPFHGHLDEPQAWSRSIFGRIPISGWLFHEKLAIKRVFATADLQAVQNLSYGRETPFLTAMHPNIEPALRCGFDGFLDLPAQLTQPVTVRVYAELEDGSWHLGSVVRIATTDEEFAKGPPVDFSLLTFWRAWRELRREFASGGITVETGPAYRREILAAWSDFAAEAPRQKSVDSHPTKPPISAKPGGAKISHVHYCTHNLSHQGAPLFLLEHARRLHRETGARLTVTSGQEGPLRREFESLGASVQIVDDTKLLAAVTKRDLRTAFNRLAAEIDLGSADLVVVNTLSTFWGVHLAHRTKRPVLYYIHESTPPRSFFRGSLSRATLASVEDSFRLADRVSFLTATSERYFNRFTDRANFCLNPGWIDVAGIDRFCAAHSREAQRERLGIAPGKKLVINVGTVCDRKGQHLFARAVDLLWHNAPLLAAEAEFLMVGGGDTAYDTDLGDFLGMLNRPNLRIVPSTGDVYPYYRAADLLACSSYEESFPRVILEAMAFGVPIVSTAVHGIPEMARDNLEALLTPSGDSAALAAALHKLLDCPDVGRSLARRARERVVTEFDSEVVLPCHLDLARSLARNPA